uniref:hypothetical protein n=1 Tax=Carnobacterium sp. TaxID=48221 RepID=UPI00344C500B
MISNNLSDLKGYVYNIMVKEYSTHTSIFFILSIPYRYKKNNEYITEYDTVSCVLSSNRREDGKHSNSFEKLNRELVEGQILRVQGRMSSWREGIKNNQLIPLTPDNKEEVSKIISRNILKVHDYELLETKEDVISRRKRIKNTAIKTKDFDSKKAEEERIKLEEEKMKLEEELNKSENLEDISEEVEVAYFPLFEVPQYKNMDM